MLDKVTKETNVGDRKAIEVALTESIVTINEMSRHGGFAPVQWVLSRFPRQPATLGDEQERADIGAIQAHLDGPTAFALQAEYRLQARKAFVGWDCGKRVQRVMLRNASAVTGPYKVGDIISYCRRPRLGETGTQWSVGSRIVGSETDPNYTHKDPSNAWVICDGLPVLIATDKLRPCTAAELLAYTYMNDQVRQPISETATQQAFIDERHEQPAKRARSTAVADPGPSAAAASSSSAAAAEPLYEPTSEEDDEMTLPEDSSKELRAKHSLRITGGAAKEAGQ